MTLCVDSVKATDLHLDWITHPALKGEAGNKSSNWDPDLSQSDIKESQFLRVFFALTCHGSDWFLHHTNIRTRRFFWAKKSSCFGFTTLDNEIWKFERVKHCRL